MKILFAGAAGEVTGSKHLIEFEGKKILLDCGLFQGHRKEADEKNRTPLFDPKELDAIILSHAHIDHSGNIPLMYKQGFAGPVYSTHATRDLCNHMLMDSAYIQEREIEWMKKKKTEAAEPLEPLYSADDALLALEHFESLNYGQEMNIFPNVTLQFFDAGHILGSALVYLTFTKADGRKLRLTFSGDLGRHGLPILRDPQMVPETDVLITETTYGNRLHASVDTVEEDLAFVVNEVAKRGGKLIIPAFALERTQEIVYHLHLLTDQGRIPELPIYVDSPLAGNVTEVFRAHPECYDEKTAIEFLEHGDNPFGFGNLKYTRSVEESKELNEKKTPMIIISASGMCEFGRVLHHLKNNIDDPRNTVLIVGYQAENTLGRKLVNGEKEVNIFGMPYKVRANIYVMDAFSAHADRSDLLDYIGKVSGVKRVFLVHGEKTQLESFKEALAQNNFHDVVVPEYGKAFEIGEELFR
jgi:metallo-beta-lactamase family protein